MRAAATLALVLAGVGCNDETFNQDDLVVTSVAVSPTDFLGDVPCGRIDGAPVAYVATFTDAAGNVLGSSPPVSCLLPVAFERVQVGDEYFAEVDVYTTTDVRPASFAGRGMVDAQGTVVVPAATTRCVRSQAPDGSFPEAGAVASLNDRVFLRGCAPIALSGGETAVLVDPDATLTGRACDDAAGAVERFVVTPDNGALPVAQVSCGADPVRYEPVVGGETYGFRVDAYAPGGTAPAAFARCTAVTRPGLPVLATCDALSNKGNVTVDLGPVFSQAMLACGTQVGRVQIASGSADPDQGSSIPCSGATPIGPLPPGPWTGRFVARTPAGAFLAAGRCSGAVVAGTTTNASCALD